MPVAPDFPPFIRAPFPIPALRYIAAMPRPSQPLRYLVAIALAVGAAMLLLTLLRATDAALSVWQRLQDWPLAVRYGVAAAFALLLIAASYGIWRLLRPSRPRAPKAAALDRHAIQTRIERLPETDEGATAARAELAELDRRRAAQTVQACLFGQISTGKSSLLHALAPEAMPAIGVIGGTTTQVQRHRGTLPDGRTLELSDVPGSLEAGDTAHLDIARAEAARCHAVLYVVDADITRAQQAELTALAGFGRPVVIVLNKRDRYDADERNALLMQLKKQAKPFDASVVAASAGHEEEITREFPDGRRDTVLREVPPQVEALQKLLQRIAAIGTETLEPGREAALLSHVDERLAQAERQSRQTRSKAAIDKFTRRAVLGALAAVAPGTDLVIQGALATALTRELCGIHGLSARDMDMDDLLARAGGLLRTTMSVTLAVVGNALKAFPGAGTLGGGIVHAVAYGLIFDSLGHALAQTLEHTGQIDRDATLESFRQRLAAPSKERLLALAKLALENRDQEAG